MRQVKRASAHKSTRLRYPVGAAPQQRARPALKGTHQALRRGVFFFGGVSLARGLRFAHYRVSLRSQLCSVYSNQSCAALHNDNHHVVEQGRVRESVCDGWLKGGLSNWTGTRSLPPLIQPPAAIPSARLSSHPGIQTFISSVTRYCQIHDRVAYFACPTSRQWCVLESPGSSLSVPVLVRYIGEVAARYPDGLLLDSLPGLQQLGNICHDWPWLFPKDVSSQ